MSKDFLMIGILGAALSLETAACHREGARAEERAQGATTQGAKGKAPEAARASPSTAVTKGELSHGKTKVTFTIALPPGLQAVHDGLGGGMISYRKGPNDFDGYGFTIGVGRSKKSTLAAEKADMLAQAEQQAAKKGKVLDKGDWDGGGWYVATSFVEGGKPHVVMMSRVVHGDTVLMCRGDGEGSAARAPEATAKILVETCKSLVVTSS